MTNPFTLLPTIREIPPFRPSQCRYYSNPKFLIDQEDTTKEKYGKLAFGAVYFPCLATISLVTAIVSHVALSILKLLQLFIPKNFSQTINEKLLGPTFQACRDTSENTAFALCCIFANFMSFERSAALFKYADTVIYDFYSSKTISNFLKLHIDGFEA